MKSYTYLIGWSKHNKFYYGVRYAKNCHPNDLWKTYFTSSKYVAEFRKEHGEPDIIQIRKTFNDPKFARIWEHKVIKRSNIIRKSNFLNLHDAGTNFLNVGGYKLKPRSKEHCKKISIAKKGKSIFSIEEKRRRSLKYSGTENPNYGNKLSEKKKIELKKSHIKESIPFFIKEKRYMFLSDACKDLNIKNKQTIFYRLRSTSDKFKDWFYEKDQHNVN